MNFMWNTLGLSWVLCGLFALISLALITYIARAKGKANAILTHLAYTDALTGLHNMNYFYQKAPALLEKNPTISYAVICCDIRNFKYINQTYGYQVGDRVLRDTANIFQEHFHGTELCARVGNDRFVLLYAMEDYPKLLRYSAVLEEVIHRQNFGAVNISLSFVTGVYEIGDKYEEMMKIVDKANLALKSVKKNPLIECGFYDEALLSSLMYQEEIQNIMHGAFANQEFHVYLQPKYDLRQNRFVGAEALVRWFSREKGLIRPDNFIPVFEKNGFVIELDFFILEEVCKKIRAWIDQGVTPIVISVNQSRIHMDNPLYTRRLRELMERYNIPKNAIELELTESMFFDDNVKLIDIMHEIHQIGFSISMDDFGSGYSSLNLLKEIPVDVLKLDKAFLEETTNSERGCVIITHVVMMARALGMCVVCEGVETEAQVTFLREINCDAAQGYYYAKPMPIEDFDSFWQKQSASAAQQRKKDGARV